MKPDNRPWVERLRQDRTAFFESLYEQAFPVTARFVRAKGGSLADARDVFQDACLIFYEKSLANELELKGSPMGYLIGIARHLYLRRLRDEPTLLDLDAALLLPQEEDEEDDPRLQRVLKSIQAVGRRCLDLLQAFYYQRLSMREIAREFGYRTERSATVQKYKCLEKVREGGSGKSEIGNRKSERETG